jgi:hypothetical protein
LNARLVVRAVHGVEGHAPTIREGLGVLLLIRVRSVFDGTAHFLWCVFHAVRDASLFVRSSPLLAVKQAGGPSVGRDERHAGISSAAFQVVVAVRPATRPQARATWAVEFVLRELND